MPAKLPLELRSEPERLRDLKVGSTAYISASQMSVEADGYCYLNPTAPLLARSSTTIQVERQENGFHITVISKDTTWRVGGSVSKDWIPVESITQDVDPEFDAERQLEKFKKLREMCRRLAEEVPGASGTSPGG